MPDALARRRAQAEDRVREEIVAVPIGSVEVVRRRSGRCVDQAARVVERDTRPRVRTAAVLPRVWRARVVAELARMRNAVKGPSLRAGIDIEGADVAGRRRQALR